MEKAKGVTNSVVSTWTFRDGEQYVISLEVTENPKAVAIQIANKITSEEWSCHYDFKYIEELSQRTGNYKTFDIFIAMIKSALLKSTESVELDLMTYEDLKALKSKRFKNGSKFEFASPSKIADSSATVDVNSNPSSHLLKRKYLIVKYVAEFDSVHYPLALSHTKGPDPFIMEQHIKKLQGEVTYLRTTNQELVDSLKTLGFDSSRLEIQNGRQNLNCGGSATNFEISNLLEAIESLEKNCATERMDHLKEMETLQGENSILRDQISALQRSEEELNTQITRLERMSTGYGVRRQQSGQSFGTVRESVRTHRPSRDRDRASSDMRSRHSSSSSEFRRKLTAAVKSTSTAQQTNLSGVRNRSRTLSPAPPSKFNPTSYVREKKQRQEQIAQLRLAEIQSNFLRHGRQLPESSSPRGNGLSSPRFVRINGVPNNTERRLALRRERSLSLERLRSQTDMSERPGISGNRRGRSRERRPFTSVGIQTKTFKPKPRLTKFGVTGRTTTVAPVVRQSQRTTTSTSFGTKDKHGGRATDFEGSLEALQAYLEDTNQKLTAYKNFGNIYDGATNK